jgi:hypothetical protein
MPRKTPDIIANLTPASGRQDHTTSPSASASFVRALTAPDAIASTASRPAYRDDREPPLQGDETVRDKEVICREAEAEHFFEPTGHEFADLPSGLFCRIAPRQFILAGPCKSPNRKCPGRETTGSKSLVDVDFGSRGRKPDIAWGPKGAKGTHAPSGARGTGTQRASDTEWDGI